MKSTLRKTILLIAAVLAATTAVARERSIEDPGTGRVDSYYKGYNWIVDEEGDSVIRYYLIDFECFSPLRFKNDRERQEYTRLIRNVKITLPYAKLIAETLIETYEYIETFPTQQERDDYLKVMEKELFKQYKPVLKRLSKTQAKVLIKLIQRETHQSSYSIVQAFLGTFRAAFWQGFGRLFGVSLKSTYNPSGNQEDGWIERIASQVELGIL